MGRRATWALLAVFLAAFAVWGVRNHRCKMDSDPGTYLKFARNLAHGRFHVDTPLDRAFADRYPADAVYLGTYSTLMHRGRGVALYAIGFPLYLAILIAVGGTYAPFFGNLLVFLALFVLLAEATRRAFPGHPEAPAAALAAPALYWVFNRAEISYFQAPYRDPLSHLCLLGAFVAAFAFFQGGRRALVLGLSGFLFGCAVCVRETSVLAILPLALWGAATAIGERRAPPPRAVAAFVLGAALGVLPTLVQNAAGTGNPFYPTQLLHSQVYFGDLAEMEGERSVRMRSLSPAYFPKTAPGLLALLFKDYHPALLALLGLGLWAGRRERAVRLLFVPLVVLYTVFFGSYLKPMQRYIFVAQIALAPLLALGLAEATARIGALVRARWLPAAASAALVLGAAAALLGERVPGLFQVPAARAFARDLAARIPAGSLVLAERPMNQVIDYLSPAHAAAAENFVRPEVGLTLGGSLAALEPALPAMFFFDSKDSFLRDGIDNTPVTRELVLAARDLTPVARFAAADYDLEDLLGRPEAVLHRITPWQHAPVEATLAAPPGGGGVLALEGRDIAPPGETVDAQVLLDGRPLGTAIAPGRNWYPVPPGPGAAGTALLRVSSPAALPRDLGPVWLGPDAPILLDVGPDAVPLDAGFFAGDTGAPTRQGRARILGGGVAARPTSGGYEHELWLGWSRVLEREGRAAVPVVPLPGTVVVLAARVLPLPAEAGGAVEISCEGGGGRRDFTLRNAGAWRTLTVPLVAPDPGRATARILLRPGPPAGATTGRPPAFALDRLTVHRIREAALPVRIGAGAAAEPYLVEGFHEPERHLDRHEIRWTNGIGRVRIPLRAADAGREAAVSVSYFGPPRAVAGADVRLSLNGVALCGRPAVAETAQEVTCAVPPGTLRAGLNELEILSPSWSPARQLGSPDPRALGVMVESVLLAAAAPPEGVR